MENHTQSPSLFLLPVPLANVRPELVMPLRNIDIARSVKHFIVENIRSARRFLKRCDPAIDISSLQFSLLNEHTSPSEIHQICRPLLQGHDMAVVSEAGCPAVADPGSLAVEFAHRHNIRVVPLVGPSSILLALMASGFNGQTWTFNGYLPSDASARRALLNSLCQRIAKHRQTQIFIETPYRNNRLIAELAGSLPKNMLLCVASDITGPAESIITRPIAQWQTATYNYDKTPAIFLLYS